MSAQRQHPRPEHRRSLVDVAGRVLLRLGDENRVRRAIGIGDVVADMVEQQHCFADCSVGQADAAREALARDRHPDDPAFAELLVG
jgi:hypothetical protein